jgi:rhodanese-related sulfurtransferase
MQTLTRQQVERKLAENRKVALIETLPEENFRKFHLPGAINIPVDDSRFAEKVAETVPDKSTPIIVYCMDADCQASPRAAKRLDELGYEQVFDYEAGKKDWRQAGNTIQS